VRTKRRALTETLGKTRRLIVPEQRGGTTAPQTPWRYAVVSAAATIVCVHQSLRQQTATAVVQQVSSAVVQQEASTTAGCNLTRRRRRQRPLHNQLCRSGRAALTV